MNRQLTHNKLRNTGILFELLSRQLTVEVMNNSDNENTVTLVRNYFNEHTELGKELELYHILLRETYVKENQANQLIDGVIKARRNLTNSILRREKYNLIKEIRDRYDISDFLRSRIPNYKIHASVYKLFLGESSEDDFNPVEMVNNRQIILEHVLNKKISSTKPTPSLISEFKEQEADLRELVYVLLVEKFNKKYKTLNTDQRHLLKEYINNLSNTNSLREFVNAESIKIKSILTELVSKVDNPVTTIKLQEALTQVDTLTKGKIVKDSQVGSLMRYYALTEELKRSVG